MTSNWDYLTIRSILENGLRNFFPKECKILDECFFLDVAVPKTEKDIAYGDMNKLEKALITISRLCLQESYRISGTGPIKAETEGAFYLVDPDLFEKRSKLSILNMVFSNFFQSSLDRFNQKKARAYLSSREGFEIILDPQLSCNPVEVPMKKIPTDKSLGDIFIENLLGDLDLQKAANFDSEPAPLPKNIPTIGILNNFETIMFQSFAFLLQQTLEKRAIFNKEDLEPAQHSQLERWTTATEIFNELFARSVFMRFPNLNEDEFLVGEGFVIGQDKNNVPQDDIQLVLLPVSSLVAPDEMLGIERSESITSVSEGFDLKRWNPSKKVKPN